MRKAHSISKRHRHPSGAEPRGLASAFTLIEIVTVVVIMALLSAVAMPVYLDYRAETRLAAEQAVVANIRSAIHFAGVHTAMSGDLGWPTLLDHAAAGSEASSSNAFFTEVLSTPVADDWKKGAADNRYLGPSGTEYVYDSQYGTFLAAADAAYDEPADAAGDTTDSDDESTSSDALTREELQAMTAAQLAALTLTPEQISWLTAEQLAELSPETLAGWSADQLHALTAAQIASLGYDQFSAVVGSLTPTQISEATPEQIAMLDQATFGALSAAQAAALTSDQLAERAVADNVRTLAYSQFRTLTPQTAKYLSAAQIASIPNSYQMSTIPSDVRAAFTEEQVQALNTANVSIGYLTASQRDQLTTSQIQSLAGYSEIRYLSAARVGEVPTSLIASLPDNYQMSVIPSDVRAAFTEEQVQALNTAKVSIGYLSDSQRDQLTTGQIQSLGRYSDIKYLSATRVPEVTTALIASLPDNYQMSVIPSDVRAAFTEEQVQALNTANVSIGYLTGSQRDQLTTSQVQSLASYNDIRYLSAGQIPNVTTGLVSAISSAYSFNQIPTSSVQAFTQEQVLAIPASFYDQVKSRLTPEQLAWRP